MPTDPPLDIEGLNRALRNVEGIRQLRMPFGDPPPLQFSEPPALPGKPGPKRPGPVAFPRQPARTLWGVDPLIGIRLASETVPEPTLEGQPIRPPGVRAPGLERVSASEETVEQTLRQWHAQEKAKKSAVKKDKGLTTVGRGSHLAGGPRRVRLRGNPTSLKWWRMQQLARKEGARGLYPWVFPDVGSPVGKTNVGKMAREIERMMVAQGVTDTKIAFGPETVHVAVPRQGRKFLQHHTTKQGVRRTTLVVPGQVQWGVDPLAGAEHESFLQTSTRPGDKAGMARQSDMALRGDVTEVGQRGEGPIKGRARLGRELRAKRMVKAAQARARVTRALHPLESKILMLVQANYRLATKGELAAAGASRWDVAWLKTAKQLQAGRWDPFIGPRELKDLAYFYSKGGKGLGITSLMGRGLIGQFAFEKFRSPPAMIGYFEREGRAMASALTRLKLWSKGRGAMLPLLALSALLGVGAMAGDRDAA
jgi:hypothetical protein